MTEQLRTYLNGNMDLIENEDFVTLIENSPWRVSCELIDVLSKCGAFYNYYPIAKQRVSSYKNLVKSVASMFNLPIALKFLNEFQSAEEFNNTAKVSYQVLFEFGKNDKYNLENFRMMPGSNHISYKGSTIVDLPHLPLTAGVFISNLLETPATSDSAIELKLKQVFARLQDKLDQGGINYDD